VEDVFDAVYEMMNETNPGKYPMFYTRLYPIQVV
jgi:hypothetical protein